MELNNRGQKFATRGLQMYQHAALIELFHNIDTSDKKYSWLNAYVETLSLI